MSTKKTLSPVAIFVYNRPKNTEGVITALQKNHLAADTDVIVFSDAAGTKRQEKKVAAVRAYLKIVTGFKSFTVIERPENYFVEKNIIEGVNEIVNKYGRIIVLEDDGVTAQNFLTFMNQALDFYDQTKRVMHIATFTFIDMPEDFRKTFFWRYTENTGGGWATWADRWEKFQYFQTEKEGLASLTNHQKERIELNGSFRCLSSLKHSPIPWDICWYMTLVRNDGLAVQTPRSLTINNGLYSGTHFSPLNKILGKHPFSVDHDTHGNITLSDTIVENEEAIEKLKVFYSTLGHRRRDKVLHKFVRILVFLKITKIFKFFLR